MSQQVLVQEAQGVLKATDYERVVTVDLEGRLIFFAENKKTYRRSIFNKYLLVGYRDGVRVARPLSEREALEVAQSAYRFLREATEFMDERLRGYLKPAIARGPDFLKEDAEKFRSIYGGEVPIVPPDQYFPVYVQATAGCYWNRCTFCNLYRGRTYRVKGQEELREHIRAVKDAFGRGMSARRGVFLGDANSLAAPQDRLVGWLRVIREELGLPVYSFVDAITTQWTKGEEELRELRELGLSRIYLGLESGSQEVLRFLGKPESLSGAVELLGRAKGAGLTVGIIVLVGAGGRSKYWEHVNETAKVISRIPLSRHDTIFLSPIYIYSWLPYYREAKELGLLSFEERLKQMEDMAKAIRDYYVRENGEELQSPIVPYDLAESIY